MPPSSVTEGVLGEEKNSYNHAHRSDHCDATNEWANKISWINTRISVLSSRPRGYIALRFRPCARDLGGWVTVMVQAPPYCEIKKHHRAQQSISKLLANTLHRKGHILLWHESKTEALNVIHEPGVQMSHFYNKVVQGPRAVPPFYAQMNVQHGWRCYIQLIDKGAPHILDVVYCISYSIMGHTDLPLVFLVARHWGCRINCSVEIVS